MVYASWRYLFLAIASKGTCKKLSAEQQFFLCRRSADWIELSKKEPITAVQNLHVIGSASVRLALHKFYIYFNFPSPAISAVISSIFSSGNGGSEIGFIAIDISFMGLSSAAIRLDESCPHLRQR